MTDRVKTSLTKVGSALGILVILIGFIASMTRAIDASTQALQRVEKLSVRMDHEVSSRVAEGRTLADAITNEREARRDEYTKIQVKLMEIDTRLLYIQQGIDSIKTR
jgi:hypothetical protein